MEEGKWSPLEGWVAAQSERGTVRRKDIIAWLKRDWEVLPSSFLRIPVNEIVHKAREMLVESKSRRYFKLDSILLFFFFT